MERKNGNIRKNDCKTISETTVIKNIFFGRGQRRGEGVYVFKVSICCTNMSLKVTQNYTHMSDGEPTIDLCRQLKYFITEKSFESFFYTKTNEKK